MKVSKAYEVFAEQAPQTHGIWMETVHKLDEVNVLDKKTKELAYIAVMAAVRLESGIPFHVKMAKSLGASRDEVLSAILLGLPAVGNIVTSSVPIAIETYDN
jgi:alkylhydroperoxidase/carboxymuconolactone decarboxylase family protein YurZ